MKVLREGHQFELANFDQTDQPGQVIKFIEKHPKPGGAPGELVTFQDGTTNEEVIKMMIARLTFQYAKFPSEETAFAIEHLKAALYALQSRTYERQMRGVEGKALK